MSPKLHQSLRHCVAMPIPLDACEIEGAHSKLISIGQGNVSQRGLSIPSGVLYFAQMYARKLQVAVLIDGERRPCPLEWLDSFCMRNFTGSAEFDDTLPTGEGRLEASLRVDPAQFASSFAQWINQRGKADGKKVQVEVHEEYVPPKNP